MSLSSEVTQRSLEKFLAKKGDEIRDTDSTLSIGELVLKWLIKHDIVGKDKAYSKQEIFDLGVKTSTLRYRGEESPVGKEITVRSGQYGDHKHNWP